MFAACVMLSSLNISSFNTENVTNMQGLFYDCNRLTSLNLSNFNTSNVKNVEGLFAGCPSLTNLNLTGWDLSSVKTWGSQFTAINANLKITCSSQTKDSLIAHNSLLDAVANFN